jgi:hypothetical protein
VYSPIGNALKHFLVSLDLFATLQKGRLPIGEYTKRDSLRFCQFKAAP